MLAHLVNDMQVDKSIDCFCFSMLEGKKTIGWKIDVGFCHVDTRDLTFTPLHAQKACLSIDANVRAHV